MLSGWEDIIEHSREHNTGAVYTRMGQFIVQQTQHNMKDNRRDVPGREDIEHSRQHNIGALYQDGRI